MSETTDVGGSYIVFKMVSGELIPDPNETVTAYPVWEQMHDAPVQALSQRAAIEQVVTDLDPEYPQTYLAVPARSFKPMTPKVVTKIEWS